jgi:magnesium-transporting ATPase (P-type)
LVEFPFDSTRKRMSTLVRDEQTKQIWLMSKGADTIMLPRISIDPKDQKKIEEQLHFFACSGLRTLVMGQKKVSEQTYKDWN